MDKKKGGGKALLIAIPHIFSELLVYNIVDFYLKLGFRIVGTAERQAKVDGKYIDEIVIEKFL